MRLCAGLLLSMLLVGCGEERVDAMYDCASPDGRMVATLYRITDGERPIDQEMRLNLHPVGASGDSDMFSFAFRHGYDAVLRWQGNSRLVVEYPRDSVITAQEMVVFGSSQTFDVAAQIALEYRQRPSTHGYFVVEQRCFRE